VCELRVTLHSGAALLGELPISGVGSPVAEGCDLVPDLAALERSCAASNAALVAELRLDVHADELMRITLDDAAMGRMTTPIPIEQCDTSRMLLHPRFGVEQHREDGSLKVRAVDNFSWASADVSAVHSGERPSKKARKEKSVNGHTAAGEKMHHDGVDALSLALVRMVDVVGIVPGLIKVGVCVCV
jgi:hypothetical protein